MGGESAGEEPDLGAAVRGRVRECIGETGLAQYEFADLIGLDQTKLSKSLRGTRRFTPDELIRIARVAGVTVNWLLSGSDSTSAPTAVPAPEALPRRVAEEPDHGRKRHQIVEAAWRLFAQHGFHAVRIADIAEASGTGSSNVLYYFSRKDELFEESLRYSVKLAFDRQVASLDTVADPLERLRHLVDLQLPTPGVTADEWSIWLQSWSAAAVGAMSQENQARAYRRWYQTIHKAIRAGQDAGAFVSEPVEDLSTQLTSLIDGLGIKVLTGALSVEKMREHIRAFIDRCLVAGPAAARPDTAHT
ncbi:TetR family transcriptional regulator C-terminal domain-containing protein [Brevibacterium daeguense]|uniref:TetR family transcriptional regulator C-terminal domain-containing protein n=1 Tax=Brevibacterium daeguense TaxID=909936 RepID=A0ABP8EHP5_9MICO